MGERRVESRASVLEESRPCLAGMGQAWAQGEASSVPLLLDDGSHGLNQNPQSCELAEEAAQENFMCHLLTFSADS